MNISFNVNLICYDTHVSYHQCLENRRQTSYEDHNYIKGTPDVNIFTFIVSDDFTVFATDDSPAEKDPNDQYETRHKCSVVRSRGTTLARCDLNDVYGRYLIVKGARESLRLCDMVVYPFRECFVHYIANNGICCLYYIYAKSICVHPIDDSYGLCYCRTGLIK